MHGILLFGTILDRFGRKWRVLRFGWGGVVELLEGFGFVTGHGQVDFAVTVIPVEVDPNVPVAGPIGAKWIVRFEYRF